MFFFFYVVLGAWGLKNVFAPAVNCSGDSFETRDRVSEECRWTRWNV